MGSNRLYQLGGIMYKVNDIFYNDEEYFDRAMFCNSTSNLHIVEIEPDDKGKRYQIQEIPAPTEEEKIQELRDLRELECFSVINRGILWYDELTQEQLTELKIWYKSWLDVTKTKTIPNRPAWL